MLSREDSIQRVRDAWENKLPYMKFTLHKILANGEFVTDIWEVDARNMESKEFFTAIFKYSEWSRERISKYGIRFTLGDQLEVRVNASLARIQGCKEIHVN